MSKSCPRHWRIRLERIEPARNRRRHWTLTREPTLFHPEGAVVQRWGRIGRWTRTRPPTAMDPHTAVAQARRLVGAKLRRGYAVAACSWVGLLAAEDDRPAD